jgi:hypothetical protein
MNIDKLLRIAGFDDDLIVESKRKMKKLLKESQSTKTNPVIEAFENTTDDYLQKTLETRNPPGTGSEFTRPMTIQELKNAKWTPLNHSGIRAPSIAYTANIPGRIGVIDINKLPDQTLVKIQLSHNGTGGKTGKAAEAVARFDTSLTYANTTCVILGPALPGYFKHSADKFMVYTFHPGKPLGITQKVNIDKISRALEGNMITTVEIAKKLGFAFVKQVNNLTEQRIRRRRR